MSITHELRKWWVRKFPTIDKELYQEFCAIADRIDAEHEKAVTAAHSNGITEYGSMVAREYVKLPVDADGEVIHIGDVMEGEKIGGGYGEPFEVIGYVMSNGELEPMDEHGNPRKRKYLRHHHSPTVEDVMVEFATDWECAEDGEDKTAVLKEYASKLQLRED